MAFTKRTLEQWLNECFADAEKFLPDGVTRATPTHLALMHVTGTVEKEIYLYKLKGKTFTSDEAIKNLAEAFRGKANTDAQEMPGAQEYRVYCFWEGSNDPQARFTYRSNGRILQNAGETATEAPTPEGKLQQSMRHSEAHFSVYMQATMNLLQLQNTMLRDLQSSKEKAEQENVHMFTLFKEIAAERIANAQEFELKRMETERNAELMKLGMRYLPLLANTLTGQEIVPQSAADTALIELFAEAVDTETAQKLAGALLGPGSAVPPAAVAVLMKRLSEISERKQAEKARLAVVADNVSPAAMAGELDAKH